jgi:ribose transport system substrate-binding protein
MNEMVSRRNVVGRTVVAALLGWAMVAVGCDKGDGGSKGASGGGGGGGGGATSAPSSSSSGKKMAIVITTMNNPWFVVLAETAQARAKELGYETTLFDSQNDRAKESSHFDNLIAAKFDAVLFNCTDSDGSIAAVRRAKEAGIPVFCMDREINATDAAVSQVLSDNYSGCEKLGQYFVKRVGEKGKYAEILGIVGDNNTTNRSKGFHSVVDQYPDLKMAIQQSGEFDRAKGLSVMTNMLQAQPDITAVFCGNDAMAMGAIQALASAGKADKVLVFGFDGSDEAVKAVADGKLAATVMQYPKTMARTAAENADKYIKGDHSMPQKIPVAVDLVTRENVAKFGDYGRKDAK